MSTDERHRRIGELLRHREHVSVDELMAECGASGATIRRDLDVLELHGVLRRVHGGARSLVLRGGNPEYGQRELEDHAAKVRIAAGVAALLQGPQPRLAGQRHHGHRGGPPAAAAGNDPDADVAAGRQRDCRRRPGGRPASRPAVARREPRSPGSCPSAGP